MFVINGIKYVDDCSHGLAFEEGNSLEVDSCSSIICSAVCVGFLFYLDCL